jgi:hypothetical protein
MTRGSSYVAKFSVGLMAWTIIQFGILVPANSGASTQTQLTAKLLSQADVPAGWYVYPHNGTASEEFMLTNGCLASATIWVIHHPNSSSVGVQGSTTQGRSLFFEGLATGKNAQHHLQLLVDDLDRCHSSPSDWRGFHIAITANPLALTGLGVNSHAFAVDDHEGLGANATDVRWDIVLFQAGPIYGSFSYQANPIRAAMFRELAVDAVHKVTASESAG